MKRSRIVPLTSDDNLRAEEKPKSAFDEFMKQYAQRSSRAPVCNKGQQMPVKGTLSEMRQKLAESRAKVDDARKRHSSSHSKGQSGLRFGGWSGRKAW